MKQLIGIAKLVQAVALGMCLLLSCQSKNEINKTATNQMAEPVKNQKPAFGSGIVPIPVYPFTKPEEPQM